ncbi:hypothetical protein [Faecalibacter sp. LW9]|uniref:hypothetical protein n=1 Tax=Faecalibacter sp. LW9 TaxID=3103144 RepID=UPI002AFF5B22|nr:hypothetical protein [Faecalibacter sp. LW9]
MAEDAQQQSSIGTKGSMVASVPPSAAPNPSSVSSPKAVPAPPDPNENRRVSKPLGTANGSAFSLKKIVEEKKEAAPEEEILRNDLPRNPYTLEDVQNFWNKFLEKLKVENNIPSYNALATTTIHLKKDNIIVLEFISASSESEYEIYKNRIMNGLRNAIKNFYFTIEIAFSQSEAKSHILTSKEKFDAFVQKNPTILKLKEEFGLDLYE